MNSVFQHSLLSVKNGIHPVKNSSPIFRDLWRRYPANQLCADYGGSDILNIKMMLNGSGSV